MRYNGYTTASPTRLGEIAYFLAKQRTTVMTDGKERFYDSLDVDGKTRAVIEALSNIRKRMI